MTTYFSPIHSLAQLKKEYRQLAIKNHPDKGGDTATMQAINAEFARLYDLWKDDKTITGNGYDNDYTEAANAQEYTQRVWREYKWTGSRYNGQGRVKVAEIIRAWLKETYKNCKFSVVRSTGYQTIQIALMEADFEAFTSSQTHTNNLIYSNLADRADLTDRAKEVAANVIGYAMSYNFDDSDSMTDYFHVNFYLEFSIGTYKKPFKLVRPRLEGSGGFSFPEGPAHKAIRKALGGDVWQLSEGWRAEDQNGLLVLSECYFRETGEPHYYPKYQYCTNRQTVEKRLAKLRAAGILCELTKHRWIKFLGYDEQTAAALKQEEEAYINAYKAWQAASA